MSAHEMAVYNYLPQDPIAPSCVFLADVQAAVWFES
jgi:hypothetical protein